MASEIIPEGSCDSPSAARGSAADAIVADKSMPQFWMRESRRCRGRLPEVLTSDPKT